MVPASKRGVSPLIATILLIAFAVALGTVVMSWGLSLGSDSGDSCAKVSIVLKKMIDKGDACYGNRGSEGYLNFILENAGSEDISGMSVWLTGQKKIELIDLGSISIPRRTIFEKTGSDTLFDFSSVGNLDQVQFIAKVEENGKTKSCTRQAVQPKELKFC